MISYSNKLKIAKNNILYLGIGVSGGTQGVLEGPSIMIGGDNSAFKKVKDDLVSLTDELTADEKYHNWIEEHKIHIVPNKTNFDKDNA